MTMNRDDVLRTLAEHKEEIRRLGVKSLAIFGSVSRNEATGESDVDVLVEFEGVYMNAEVWLNEYECRGNCSQQQHPARAPQIRGARHPVDYDRRQDQE